LYFPDSAKSGDAAENNTKLDNKIGSTAEITESIDNLSLSSHSSDTTSIRGEEAQKASPATTILRPRSGKEYLKVDRKKFSEDISQTEPRTPTSPTGVFTFEDNMMGSESPSRNCYIGGRGNHSPKSPDSVASSEGRAIPPRIGDPNYVGARDRDRVYMNMDMTPPGPPPSNSCYSVSPQPLEQTNPYLNYAELDLSPGNKHRPYVTPIKVRQKDPELIHSRPQPEPIHSRPQSAQINYADLDLVQPSKDNKKKVRKPVQRASSIEYAQINMVFTEALSKTGKEHALYREDPSVSSLRRNESKKTSSPLLSGITTSRKAQTGFFRDRKGSNSMNS
jgi:hypothetical protein